MQVADVARRAGVHPVYLARCVRRWYRTGVAEELRRLRVRSAAAGLAESSRTVSDLAHDNGFADEAHLCRTFRRATGIPPGAFRSLLRELPEPVRVATT
jgi:AraC family transcriptional regulator